MSACSLPNWSRAVVKVGSALVAPDDRGCSTTHLLPIARFVADSRRQGKDVILVSSGAVAAGLADKCEIQVAYAIGVAEPMSVFVDTFGTGRVSETRLVELVRAHFDLRPYGILQMLDLVRPIYRPTASYGHFGRDEPTFTWERTDRAEALREAAGL